MGKYPLKTELRERNEAQSVAELQQTVVQALGQLVSLN